MRLNTAKIERTRTSIQSSALGPRRHKPVDLHAISTLSTRQADAACRADSRREQLRRNLGGTGHRAGGRPRQRLDNSRMKSEVVSQSGMVRLDVALDCTAC